MEIQSGKEVLAHEELSRYALAMLWLKDTLKGVLGNALYDAFKTWGLPLLIAHLILPGYAWLATVSLVPWDWRIFAGLFALLVIFNVIVGIKLVKGRPVRLSEEEQRELQRRKQEALLSGSLERAGRNTDTIWRRAEEVEKNITDALRIIQIMGHLNVPVTREISEAMTNGPTRLEPIEQALIDEANSIEHEMTWPTFRAMANAAARLNAGIATFNEQADDPLCQRLLRMVEEIRQYIFIIRRERLEREK